MRQHPDKLQLLKFVMVSAAVFVSSGCGRSITSEPGKAPNLEKWVAEVKSRAAPPIEVIPLMQQFETFEYAAQSLRDPFSDAFATDSGGSGPRPNSDRRRQPLEQFPLDSLDMVGTLGRGGGLVGLVMSPDKVTHRVRPGVYLGQSDGRVTAVYEDRIEIVELVPDGAGGWLERPATVALENQ